MFVNNQHFIQWRGHDFDKKIYLQSVGYGERVAILNTEISKFVDE